MKTKKVIIKVFEDKKFPNYYFVKTTDLLSDTKIIKAINKKDCANVKRSS